jgi:hypothetical protein
VYVLLDCLMLDGRHSVLYRREVSLFTYTAQFFGSFLVKMVTRPPLFIYYQSLATADHCLC